MKYKRIAERIIELKNADLELRQATIKSAQLGDGYNEEMALLNNRNAKELEEIIDRIGYPTVEKVGIESSKAAFVIIQHAIARPHFMRKSAELLKMAVIEKKAEPKDLAYLTDRIAVFEGKRQRYVTQIDWNRYGEMQPNPIDEPSKVNERSPIYSELNPL